MGWDAYSTKNKLVVKNGKHDYHIINSKHRKAFKDASEFVLTQAKSVDWLLEHGGLDCSFCAEMLEEATGMDCWSEHGLTSEEVKAYAENANWDFGYSEDDAWAYWSARMYLDTVAKCGLPIVFSW